MPKKILLRTLLLAAIAVALVAAAVSAITGDEILAQMEDSFGTDRAEQGLLMSLQIDNVYAGGVESGYHLAVVAKTGIDPEQPEASDETTYMLMYFRGGDDEGSIFLLHTPEDDAVDSRLWLFLPALGVTKELVSEDDQQGSFAGSTISYEDIAGAKEMRDDYTAQVLREDTYIAGDESRDVWVLELTPRTGIDADHARAVLWVDQEDFLMLRLEVYDAAGTLESELDVTLLGAFEGGLVQSELIGIDHKTGDVSTIALYDLRRPDVDLSLETFDPEHLASFDLDLYGFQD